MSRADYFDLMDKKAIEQRDRLKNPKPSKYGNTKVDNKDGKFDSLKEYNRFRELLILQWAWKISKLKTQVPFLLQESFTYRGESIRKIEYFADFTYERDWELVIEDVKSKITQEDKTYRLKVKLLKKKYPDHLFIETC